MIICVSFAHNIDWAVHERAYQRLGVRLNRTHAAHITFQLVILRHTIWLVSFVRAFGVPLKNASITNVCAVRAIELFSPSTQRDLRSRVCALCRVHNKMQIIDKNRRLKNKNNESKADLMRTDFRSL